MCAPGFRVAGWMNPRRACEPTYARRSRSAGIMIRSSGCQCPLFPTEAFRMGYAKSRFMMLRQRAALVLNI